jgi:hypothetical protein
MAQIELFGEVDVIDAEYEEVVKVQPRSPEVGEC